MDRDDDALVSLVAKQPGLFQKVNLLSNLDNLTHENLENHDITGVLGFALRVSRDNLKGNGEAKVGT